MSSDSDPVDDKASDSMAESSAAEEQASVVEPAAASDAVTTPAGEEPTAEEPVVEAPVAEEPAVDEPAVEEPAVDVPVAEGALPEVTLCQGAPADATADPDYTPVVRGRIDRFGVAMGTGRRKTSVARVRIRPGKGEFQINGRSLDDYFGVERDRHMVLAPLRLTGKQDQLDVHIRVNGGGTTGQTGAIVLGIARALQVLDSSLHQTLSEAGFLTRDGRMVERKKYGLRKARRSFQFSKR